MIDRDVVASSSKVRPNSRCAVSNAASMMLVELEIRLDRRLVEVVALYAHLLGVIAPVPRLDGDVAAVRLRQRLQVVALAPRRAHRPAPRRRPRSSRTPPGVFGHRVGEPEIGVGRVAQQLRRARRAAPPSRR